MSTLYLVATPIGNLSDLSPRAREVLSTVDFIAAEDTRVTQKLLNACELPKKPMISYYDHNRRARGEAVLEKLLAGETCALVTDAGSPAISDPGEDLVRLCRENGIEVESVPGPSALITALAVSGMSTGRFCFEGFLSVNKSGRAKHLFSLKNEKRTMIFYEAPHKLAATLSDMLEYFGDREIALVKELTKNNESYEQTSLAAAAEKYKETPPRGELVVIVSGATEIKQENCTLEDAVRLACELIDKGNPASYAAKCAAVKTGFRKIDIYKLLV